MNNKIIALALISTIFILLPITQAKIQYTPVCLDESTLILEAKIDTNISGTFQTYPINQTVPCNYGCDSSTNTCQPAPFQQTLIAAGVVFGILALAGILIKIKS